MIEPRTLKGFRDFLPSEARKRKFVIDTLQEVFELYGFEPLETPTLEYEEILSGKYGQEGDKLMYRFIDQGDRRVAMRYDQTVPLARVIAEYGSPGSPQSLPMPFKRYQIQNVWRAENTQKGRYREFLQADIDTIGTDSDLADAEILAVVEKVYKKLGFNEVKILINDRTIFEGLSNEAIIIIDKLSKIGEDKVIEELEKIGVSKDHFEKIKKAEPTTRLQNIIEKAMSLGVPESALEFEPTLARGLDYYTSLIFEVVSSDYKAGSLCGGGRYDQLIGMFSKSDFSAVGCAFGFDRTVEAMNELNLFPSNLSTTDILVTVFSPDLLDSSIKVINLLRKNDLNSEIFLDSTTKIDKQIKYADKKNIPYVIIIGPDEVQENKATIKNLLNGTQVTTDIDNLPNEFK